MGTVTSSAYLFALATLCNCHGRGVDSYWKGGANILHSYQECEPQFFQVETDSDMSSKASNASLTASPAVIEQGAMVTIVWKGVKPIAGTSWISVYCPQDSVDSDWLDYVYLQTDNEEGGIEVGPLVNMRCVYEFRFFLKEGVPALCHSNAVSFQRGTSQPLQGRLSLTHLESEMRVMWVSDTSTTPTVQYHPLDNNSTVATATGNSSTYTANSMCGPPATTVSSRQFRDPGYMHDAIMENLKPFTYYKYRFGDGKNWSDWFQFKSAQPQGNPDSEVNMFVFGDLGEWRTMLNLPPENRSYTTMYNIHEGLTYSQVDYDLLLHVGDISYAEGAGYIWEQFGHMIEPTATRIPYHVAIGNHEYDHTSGGQNDPSKAKGEGFHPSWGNYGDDSNGECGVPMTKRFHMPEGGNGVFWYSHEYANIHFTWISTEHNCTAGSEMYNWLENDLASVNRARTPWLILLGHRPMYASGMDASDWSVSIGQRQAYEDLLHKYGVDLFLTGHYHSYERVCPVYKGECQGSFDNPLSTIHIVLGMAGAGHDAPKWYDVPWSVARSVEYGYTQWSVANSSHLHLQYVQNVDGKVHDDVWIQTSHSWHLGHH